MDGVTIKTIVLFHRMKQTVIVVLYSNKSHNTSKCGRMSVPFFLFLRTVHFVIY